MYGLSVPAQAAVVADAISPPRLAHQRRYPDHAQATAYVAWWSAPECSPATCSWLVAERFPRARGG